MDLIPQDELRLIGEAPELRAPVLIAGFAGWSDAGQAVTFALQSLVTSWSAHRFAEIDPESFFDFTETRPNISLGPTGQRSLQWPANALYGHRFENHDRDVVLFIGTEPHLRWKTFCRLIVTVARQANVSCLVTLGALLADVPHTRETTLTGFASTHRLLPQLKKMGVRMSTYEGPTGIMGALHDAWRPTNLPAISLWGNVPHYISATPNPQVSLALLRRVSVLLGTPLPVGPLERQARAFSRQVDDALKENPEAQEYVHELEEQQTKEAETPADAPGLIEALEEFLRAKRPPEGETE
jgi:proteasome assembly chaperone (PAC2) family protein